MARTHAFLQLDADRAPEQTAFLRARVTVLREAGGHLLGGTSTKRKFDTFVAEGFSVSTFPAAGVLDLGPVTFRPASETPQPPAALQASPPTGSEPAFSVIHRGAGRRKPGWWRWLWQVVNRCM